MAIKNYNHYTADELGGNLEMLIYSELDDLGTWYNEAVCRYTDTGSVFLWDFTTDDRITLAELNEGAYDHLGGSSGTWASLTEAVKGGEGVYDELIEYARSEGWN